MTNTNGVSYEYVTKLVDLAIFPVTAPPLTGLFY